MKDKFETSVDPSPMYSAPLHVTLLFICFLLISLLYFSFAFFFIFLMWGQGDLETSAHSISSPRPTPRRKKCPRTNEVNPDCQNILPRTTLSSADQNHRRGRRHIARGSPLEDPKGDSEPNGSAIGAW